MAAGRVLRQGTLTELLAGQEGGAVEVTIEGTMPASVVTGLAARAELLSRAGNTFVMRAADSDAADRLVEATKRAGGRVVAMQPVARRLEDVFLREVAGQAGSGS